MKTNLMKLRAGSLCPNLSFLRSATISTFFLLCFQFSQAQFIKTYGSNTLNERGTVLLPELDNTNNNQPTGNLFVAGARMDSTMIMRLAPDGSVLNTWTFKVCLPGEMELPQDLRYDRTTATLIGCGRIPAPPLGNQNLFRAYAFRFNPATNSVVWGQRFQTFGSGQSIMDLGNAAAMELHMFGWFFNVQNNQFLDHAANYVRLDLNTGAILGASDRIYTNANSNSPDDHVAAEFDPVTSRFFATGRWGYSGASGSYRSNLFSADATGNQLYNNYLLNAEQAIARLNGADVLVEDPIAYVLTNGDFVGTTTINTTFALTAHNKNNGAVLWGMRYNLAGFGAGEFSAEVIRASPTRLLIYGGATGTNRNVFLMLVNDVTGAVEWTYTYDSGADDWVTYSSQRELVMLNNSYYMVGTQLRTPTDQDLLLLRVPLSGRLEGCASDTVAVDTIPVMGFTPNQSTLGGVNLAAAQFPPTVVAPLPIVNACGCFAANDPNYMQINNSIVLTGNHTWPSKVFIAANVVVSVVNGTLDITNSDVVLEPCAKIDIGADGNIRANNSVFRPCDELLTWDGIRVFDQGRGVFNACTFKNALGGIQIIGSSTTNDVISVRITENNFINCRRGITTNACTLTEGIAGNRFFIDQTPIQYDAACETAPYNNQHFGILARATRFRGLVAQNDFIDNSDPNSVLNFHGITWNGCSGVLAQNHFSNMYEAVGLDNCQNVSVENNEIELTMSLRAAAQSQIRVATLSNSVWVTGNRLTNVVEQYPVFPGPTGAAIYLERSSVLNVKENTVEGFVTGIMATDISGGSIAENNIRNADLRGIVVQNGRNLFVTCNVVKMRARPNAQTIGIQYIRTATATNPGQQPRFIGNCIFDCFVAVHMSASNIVANLPVFRNNYLYNYQAYGMNINGFNGSIGTSIANFDASGHNSFISNNVTGGAVDISSALAITAFGNFGLSTVSATVNVVGNNLYNSTSSCGQQVGTISSQFVQGDYCDQYTDNIAASLLRVSQGSFDIFETMPQGSPERFQLAVYSLAKLLEADPAQATRLHDHVIQAEVLTPAQADVIHYLYLRATASTTEALDFLPNLENNEELFQGFVMVEGLALQQMASASGIDGSTATILASMAVDASPAANFARAYLQPYDLDHNFQYEAMKEIEDIAPGSNVVDLLEAHLEVYPNPSTGDFSVSYSLKDPAGAVLKVVDVLGKTMLTQQLSSDFEVLHVNAQDWSSGVYFVIARDAQGQSISKKLVVE